MKAELPLNAELQNAESKFQTLHTSSNGQGKTIEAMKMNRRARRSDMQQQLPRNSSSAMRHAPERNVGERQKFECFAHPGMTHDITL